MSAVERTRASSVKCDSPRQVAVGIEFCVNLWYDIIRNHRIHPPPPFGSGTKDQGSPPLPLDLRRWLSLPFFLLFLCFRDTPHTPAAASTPQTALLSCLSSTVSVAFFSTAVSILPILEQTRANARQPARPIPPPDRPGSRPVRSLASPTAVSNDLTAPS